MFQYVGSAKKRNFTKPSINLLGIKQEIDVNYWVVTWLPQE